MYSIDWARVFSRARPALSSDGDAAVRRGGHVTARPRISPVVWALGFTSFFTDISSEMVSSVLPIYLVAHLHLSPVAFGAIDGLFQGFAAFARLAGGFLADRWARHKAIAAFGYGLSAACRLALLAAGNSWPLLASTIALDRTGKGIRTAPRDALIALSCDREHMAASFGVHRSLDAAGAVLGPLVAFGIFWFLPGAFDVLFVVSFCVAVIGLGTIALFVRAPSGNAPRASSAQPVMSLRMAGQLLRLPPFRRLLAVGAILSLATVSDSFVFLTLQRQLDLASTYFPLLYVGVAACNSLLAIPIGRIADRRGRRRTFLAGYVLLLLAYLTLLTPIGGLGRALLTLGLLGAYYAATDGVLTAIAGRVLPAGVCGSGLALLATVTNGSRLVASLLFGALWQWTGLAGSVAIFSGALAAATILGAVVMRSEFEPLGADEDQAT
jgi:MFS family permease